MRRGIDADPVVFSAQRRRIGGEDCSFMETFFSF